MCSRLRSPCISLSWLVRRFFRLVYTMQVEVEIHLVGKLLLVDIAVTGIARERENAVGTVSKCLTCFAEDISAKLGPRE